MPRDGDVIAHGVGGLRTRPDLGPCRALLIQKSLARPPQIDADQGRGGAQGRAVAGPPWCARKAATPAWTADIRNAAEDRGSSGPNPRRRSHGADRQI